MNARADIEQVVRISRAPVLRFLRRRYGMAEEEAEELFQEAAILMMTKLDAAVLHYPSRPLLIRLSHGLAANRVRTRSTRARILHDHGDDIVGETSCPPPHEPMPHGVLQRLAQLPEPLREIFLMRSVLGWSAREVGRRFGLSPGSVDRRRDEARKQLLDAATAPREKRHDTKPAILLADLLRPLLAHAAVWRRHLAQRLSPRRSQLAMTTLLLTIAVGGSMGDSLGPVSTRQVSMPRTPTDRDMLPATTPVDAIRTDIDRPHAPGLSTTKHGATVAQSPHLLRGSLLHTAPRLGDADATHAHHTPPAELPVTHTVLQSPRPAARDTSTHLAGLAASTSTSLAHTNPWDTASGAVCADTQPVFPHLEAPAAQCTRPAPHTPSSWRSLHVHASETRLDEHRSAATPSTGVARPPETTDRHARPPGKTIALTTPAASHADASVDAPIRGETPPSAVDDARVEQTDRPLGHENVLDTPETCDSTLLEQENDCEDLEQQAALIHAIEGASFVMDWDATRSLAHVYLRRWPFGIWSAEARLLKARALHQTQMWDELLLAAYRDRDLPELRDHVPVLDAWSLDGLAATGRCEVAFARADSGTLGLSRREVRARCGPLRGLRHRSDEQG